ncbi:hypothetical protein SFOMI_4601 [Sphingobium fuliginis]|uniref:Uncharacterized protein n=1 Tax=Sphingobium fuliginis (strain ATCC 27551) TaxID=336203 RepID=A0A292ZMB8_SPHSA|nr:hypothetical protein SFOMI_4601 [Sphingobium fuliginis]
MSRRYKRDRRSARQYQHPTLHAHPPKNFICANRHYRAMVSMSIGDHHA